MKISTWLTSLLFAFPLVAQASIITIEYSGVVTWSMESRPGREFFSYEEGDRISGVAVIDLSNATDEAPETNKAYYRSQPQEDGLLKNTIGPGYVTEHLDSITFQDDTLYSGEVVDRITLDDRAIYYKDLGHGGYENSDFNFSLFLILDSDAFIGDNLQNLKTGQALTVLPGSTGSASASWMHYSNQMVGGAWADGIDFTIDSVKVFRSNVPEPASLASLLLGIFLLAARRRVLRMKP